ncbi:TPA: hypothetical protein QCV86_002988 [Bacillus thuringiensis]|uniref:hypothetical protein n=1 Tax=Bacillus cereus group TaxID=86661 RepID=UPI0005C293A1|nr:MULTISPECIES: hypothetical protein [Bacillus cereus group]MBG9674767.1 hypothetical protein [Bacillus thuringiensis]MBU0451121.1 hypothetical protein [Bacillus thuringiensis]MCC3982605.1 hypothetical protein [Bacillus thuringiensis serovar kurstaki]MCR6840962.1 hypothetical protein [Bacillus thuringiensis]MCU5013261.1 hypothetical protein [Bacillus cereus]
MGRIHFTLEKTLNDLDISPYRLSVISTVRSNTIADMVSNQSSRINISTLELVIAALNKISEEQGSSRKFNVTDVFIYVD